MVTDLASGAVIYGSPGKELLGVTEADLHAKGPGALQRLVDPADPAVIQRLNTGAAGLADGQSLEVRYQARYVDGHLRWLNHCVTPFRKDDSGAVVDGVLAVLRDVTDVVDAEERLTHAARHDTLTGLPNRALLVEALDAALLTTAPEAGARSRSCSATWTGSSASTTPAVTPPGTPCCSRQRGGCGSRYAQRTWWPGWR